jgi:hypothetical protein
MFKKYLLGVGLVAGLALNALATPIGDFKDDFSDGLTLSDWIETHSQDELISPGSSHTYALTNAFTTTNTSQTVTVSHTAHGLTAGRTLIFEATSGTVGNLNMDGVWTVATVLDANSYTFTHTGTANANAGPSATTRAIYSIAGQDGKIRFLCEPSHLRYDDPIVAPGQPGGAHLHEFFGNTATNASSTYESLRETGSGSCEGGPLNRTGYWMPAMIDTATNTVVRPFHIQLYYLNNLRQEIYDDGTGGFSSPACSCGGAGEGHVGCNSDLTLLACPQFPSQDFPRGFVAIHGYKTSAQTVATGSFTWKCLVNGTSLGVEKSVFYDPNTPSNGLTACGNQGESTSLSVRLDTASCWDGTDGLLQTNIAGNTDHFSHLANSYNDQYSNFICPATHPYKLPQITLIVEYPVNTTSAAGTADIYNWHLSSDRYAGATFRPGESFHTDWYGAWNRRIQFKFHKDVNGMRVTPRSYPYQYNSSGLTAVGGGGMINTVDAGLGNDCSDLGISGNCSLLGGQGQSLGNGFTISAAWENVRTAMPSRAHGLRGKKLR